MTKLQALCAYQDQLTREVLDSLDERREMDPNHEQLRREAQAEIVSAFDAAFTRIFTEKT